MPRPKDIGLIFEVILKNSNEIENELLKYRIRANGKCCVSTTPAGMFMEKRGSIIGGDFGFISPGDTNEVFLIWPSISLFDRVGVCPIVITSVNMENEERIMKQFIKFDTRLKILLPEIGSMMEANDSIDYHKSFKGDFNTNSQECREKYKLYYIFSEKCLDISIICSKPNRFAHNFKTYQNHLKKSQKLPPTQDLATFKANYSLKNSQIPKEKNNSDIPNWLHGLGGGLLIVFATIAIYLIICISLFFIVIWCTRRTNSRTDVKAKGSDGRIITPPYLGSSEENIPLYTTSSLLSQR
ncbi:uncharacterized protein ACRADG_000630 isoform 2-T3 [Cochliomyia hominivorax]